MTTQTTTPTPSPRKARPAARRKAKVDPLIEALAAALAGGGGQRPNGVGVDQRFGQETIETLILPATEALHRLRWTVNYFTLDGKVAPVVTVDVPNPDKPGESARVALAVLLLPEDMARIGKASEAKPLPTGMYL